ncbi:hypothetical protein [Halalkalibacter urbisdiaboli]|uniref:hypothetical protein n=1 Tax=Halalkalibacter urbisdiaboli TaxID=1960589 RepID=UPI000B43C639|nr:hypothetical protein [Halalkalibacter urbisdiaboli]
MTSNLHTILQKEELLYDFIACPYRFYFQKNLGTLQLTWQHVVQNVINQIVLEYFQLSLNERTSLNVLHLIGRHWGKVNRDCFHNVAHYVTTFAFVSDHLLLFLLSEKRMKPPVFLFEEQKDHATLLFDVGNWTEHSFVIKKILSETDETLLPAYWNVVKAFSVKTFGRLPEQIEVFDLKRAHRYIHLPKQNEQLSSIEDIPCLSCSFLENCMD